MKQITAHDVRHVQCNDLKFAVARLLSGMTSAEWDDSLPRNTRQYVLEATDLLEDSVGEADNTGDGYMVPLDPPLTLSNGEVVSQIPLRITNGLLRGAELVTVGDVFRVLVRASGIDELDRLDISQAFWLVRLAYYDIGMIPADKLGGTIRGESDFSDDFLGRPTA